MASWLREGKLRVATVQAEHGSQHVLLALFKLWAGENFGLLMLSP
jgi:NADPH-dependent curcumin reductase CurA